MNRTSHRISTATVAAVILLAGAASTAAALRPAVSAERLGTPASAQPATPAARPESVPAARPDQGEIDNVEVRGSGLDLWLRHATGEYVNDWVLTDTVTRYHLAGRLIPDGMGPDFLQHNRVILTVVGHEITVLVFPGG